jgi:SAM-dependent methyltransferase
MMVLRIAGLAAAIALTAAAAAAYAKFGAFLPWREQAEAGRLARVVTLRPGQTVAEIGAGTSRFTAAMARIVGNSGRVFSSELNPERRPEIADRVAADGLRNVTVLEATANATNLPDANCDVVFPRNVYHHVQEPERFAASVARAIKPGGVAVVIDFEPGALWLHGGKPDDASPRPGHGVSRQDAIREFRTAGLEPRRDIPDWSGPMWLVVFQRVPSAPDGRGL